MGTLARWMFVLVSGVCCLPGHADAIHATALAASSTPMYPVVDTAQTQTYNASVPITAPAVGQAFYGQDAQFNGRQPSYSLSTDGKTVVDHVTGLTWMRGPNTTLTAPQSSDKKTYSQAQTWVASVNAQAYGGFSDWRLPSIKELYALMNFKGTDPSSYTGSDTSVLTPFIDTRYFLFGYGQTSAGERIIDSQYASSTVFVVNPAETGSAKLFGLNLADGRIKGYDLAMPGGSEKTFFVQLVRGPATSAANNVYGVNSFTNNQDGTVTDAATGLMWSQDDSGTGMTWQDALAWVQSRNAANYLGHSDWRLPNAKELHTLVNYANAPDFNGKPAIDTSVFATTAITNENGDSDFPYFWTSTTHAGYSSAAAAGSSAVYIPFGRCLGRPSGAARWVDVHGAGCQRSDPKVAPPYTYATTYTTTKNGVSYKGYSFGPQGDALRGLNFVRLVRDASGTATTTPPVCTLAASPVVIATGGSATLSANCTPATTSYTWTNSGFGNTTSSGTISPTAPTLYSVTGSNAAGSGNTASAAVYVCNTPPAQNYSPIVLGGTSANDQLASGIANDSLDGAAGLDTVIYNCNRSSFTLSKTTAGWTVSSQAEGLDTLSNVERLRFGDETLALDISGNAGQAYRLYQAAFNRTPDNGGLKYWIGQLDAGMSLQEVAARFIDSNEFRQLYGTNPNNADFLTRLYNNVLHRAPDAGGYAWWLDQLNTGLHTQTTALLGFSESPENQAGVLNAIINGIDLLN